MIGPVMIEATNGSLSDSARVAVKGLGLNKH